jgi:parvulin-like peptidyl-prolyl isomerase
MEKKEIPKKKTEDIKREKELRVKALAAEKKIKMINIGLAAVLLLVVVAGGVFLYANTAEITDSSPGWLKQIASLSSKVFPESKKPAAIVNGEEITDSELQESYATVPDYYKEFINQSQWLDKLVDEKLLLQEASKGGYVVEDADIDSLFENASVQENISKEELEETLIMNFGDMTKAREFYKKQLKINSLLMDQVMSAVEISETDIRDYYFTNEDQFKTPESANVSHILICYNDSLRCESNLTKPEALDRALEVRGMISDTNFAELALEYSYEPAAQVTQGSLGWVSRDIPFDQTFLDETFALRQARYLSLLRLSSGTIS